MHLLVAAEAGAIYDTHWFMQVCEWLAAGIATAGILVIVFGVAKATVVFIKTEIDGGKLSARDKLRMDLGYYLLLGLEILVAADIIETLMAPSLDHVAVLGAIVVIRTVISVSLNWELGQEHRRTASAGDANNA